MLSRNVIKIGVASLIVVLSIGICIIGYKLNADKQRNNKIEYAKVTVKNEAGKLNQLTDSVNALFQDDQQVFLAEGVSEEKIDQVASTVLILKTTSEDFGLKSNELTIDAVIPTTKKMLSQKVKDAQRKYKLQGQTSELFLNPVLLLTVEDQNNFDNPITENVTLEGINKIRENVGSYNDDWRKAMMAFLNSAQEQLELYTQMNVSLDEMLDGETLTDKANYDSYNALFNQLPTVKNEQLKQGLSEKLAKIANLLGASVSQNPSSTTAIVPEQQVTPQNYVDNYTYFDDYGNPIVQY